MRNIKHIARAIALACASTGALAVGIPVVGPSDPVGEVMLSICTTSDKQDPPKPAGGSTNTLASDGTHAAGLPSHRQAVRQALCTTTDRKEAAK